MEGPRLLRSNDLPLKAVPVCQLYSMEIQSVPSYSNEIINEVFFHDSLRLFALNGNFMQMLTTELCL